MMPLHFKSTATTPKALEDDLRRMQNGDRLRVAPCVWEIVFRDGLWWIGEMGIRAAHDAAEIAFDASRHMD